MDDHANDGMLRKITALHPNADEKSVGVEFCLMSTDAIYGKTLVQAVQVVSQLCKIYYLQSSDVVYHYDVTYKRYPKLWVDEPNYF